MYPSIRRVFSSSDRLFLQHKCEKHRGPFEHKSEETMMMMIAALIGLIVKSKPQLEVKKVLPRHLFCFYCYLQSCVVQTIVWHKTCL